MNKKILHNSLWMMLEKVISIFGLVFVTSFVAKYTGPSVFGYIAYATSIFQIVVVIGQMGTDVILFKKISKNERLGIKLINASFKLRSLIYFVFSIPVIIFFCFNSEKNSLYYVLSIFISCFFSSVDIVSIYNDAKLQSKKNTIINLLGISISLSIRWLIPFFDLEPVYLCIPIILTSAIPFFIRLYYYRDNLKIRNENKNSKRRYTKYILTCGSSLVISSVSTAIYPRLGLLILGTIEGSQSVGVFSVAAALSGSWAFVCNSLITSYLPSIFKEVKLDRAIKKASELNILIVIISTPILVVTMFFGKYIIYFLYGQDYISAYPALVILSFSTAISLLSTVSARFIAKLSGYSYLAKKMIIITLFSLILCYILIAKYGLLGAAIAALVTEVISLSISNYFFKNSVILKLHINTLLSKPLIPLLLNLKFWRKSNF